MVRKAPRREICARCGRAIDRGQVPSVWRDYVVCARCHSRLKAIEPATALTPGAIPVLKYAPRPPKTLAPYDPRGLLSRAVSIVSGRSARPQD